MTLIPFNRPYTTGAEWRYIQEAIANGHLSGNGPFTRRCTEWLEAELGCERALLTPSCTAALEMTAILAEVGPGDEVIMPSFTFVSTANAVALRGGVPVFVDVRADTLNLDETQLAGAVTPRTKAVIAVHYAGVGCELDEIVALARDRGVVVIEDAAQGICATYRDRPLGSIGEVAALSFHETKNVTCGEGGALLVNGDRWIERAEIIHEKGTDRRKFFRGEVDKYSWVDIGSSYPLSEVNAAFLWAQLQEAWAITERRLAIWDTYHEAFADLEAREQVRRPIVPPHCKHNAHMYYLLLRDLAERDAFIRHLRARDVYAVFHYVPLHSSRAGRCFGRTHGSLPVTQSASDRLVRLPLWPGMGDDDVARVIDAVHAALRTSARGAVARR